MRLRQLTAAAFNVRQAQPTAAANPAEIDDANGFNDPAKVAFAGALTWNTMTGCPLPPF